MYKHHITTVTCSSTDIATQKGYWRCNDFVRMQEPKKEKKEEEEEVNIKYQAQNYIEGYQVSVWTKH